MKKVLVVVDMQNDFIDGSLGSDAAKAIVPNVVEKIKNFDGNIIFTKDTHFEKPFFNYPAYQYSLEGKLLPVPHCMIDKDLNKTHGNEINVDVFEAAALENGYCWDIDPKFTFGDIYIRKYFANGIPDEIEICGLCTDICVVSNALILRAMFPNTPIKVDPSCCAGTTPENHEAALKVMKSCQIEVI